MTGEDTGWAVTAILWAALIAFLITGSPEAGIIVAAVAGAALAAVTARESWRRAGRLHRRLTGQEAPRADFAFLANCLWCADLSDDASDCICGEGCAEVGWCVARYDRTNTSIGAIPVYREDGRG